ncbi:hypothetical protein ACNQ1N_01395 [Mycoplasma sp. HF11B]|uniref:hypothetical protein n=1 Tax=unclassified Mycoplasma TaxID=2683645 RepID=UPI003AAAB754
MNKIKNLEQLKIVTIIHLILVIITTSFTIPIYMTDTGFGVLRTLATVFSGAIYLATFVVFIIMLVTTATLTSYVSQDNKTMLWVSFIFSFFFPVVSWILNFIVISRETSFYRNQFE